MSVDYNSKNQRVGAKRGGGRSANALTGVSKNRNDKVNNKFTGFVVKSGGHPGAEAIRGTSGLHLNQDSKPVDTAHNKDKTVWKGGGTTATKNVHGNPCVSPE